MSAAGSGEGRAVRGERLLCGFEHLNNNAIARDREGSLLDQISQRKAVCVSLLLCVLECY